MIRIPLKLFAQAKDLVQSERIMVELSAPATIGDLKLALKEQYPMLEPVLPSLLFALGTTYADDSTVIDAESEIACFPPVSGG